MACIKACASAAVSSGSTSYMYRSGIMAMAVETFSVGASGYLLF
ncbi:hypothetical protein [Erwinia tracheiphila]|nr:hypothetical protein [Erwinia tracheiphila]